MKAVSSPAMTELISKNFNLHSLKIPSQTKGMKVFYLANLTYVDSGLSCDTFNIIHITNGKQLTEGELTEAVNHFRGKQFAFCIWISEENLIGDVRSIFKKVAVAQQNIEPGMVLNLNEYSVIKNSLYEQIRTIHTNEELVDYAWVIAANWTPPDKNVTTYFKTTADHLLNKENKIVLLAHYTEGKPVSVLEMFPTDTKTIGIYGLATLSSFRGKGIGSSLLTFALNRAKELGYTSAILQASEDGIGIYQRLGFNVHTKYYEFT